MDTDRAATSLDLLLGMMQPIALAIRSVVRALLTLGFAGLVYP
jgi:hypothetical protein